MPTTLSDKAVAAINGGLLAHLVTVNPDGSPLVRCVWTFAEPDALTIGSMGLDKRYVRNLQRDQRVSVSYESGRNDAHGLAEYLVVEGTAEVVGPGGRELLTRLAKAYIGPDSHSFEDPSLGPGDLIRIAINRVGGHGDWVN
ncbi:MULTISPECIES: pyridoxamine 5'-phosphate oxidase family protein [unclassified Nocardia]|uniref:pyridoxamine 5'-phosphate oxidase family protein n=1 Tax=unclassified Nocardia TaxID=2637762 RepID=UPI001CE4408C|nr:MULTISPECIES: pyridoxamine 5'-phosphate oxidase family protein [unclassified Nocardia]